MADANSTKRALAEAMKALMAQRAFAKISVGDICARCQMNRKSFYYHFRDKYDLVNWIFYTEFVEAISQRPDPDAHGWQLLEDICAYFYENRRFYTKALQVEGQNSFQEYFHGLLQPIVQEHVAGALVEGEHARFFAVFFTDAFVMAIERWLCQTPCRPPEAFVHLLKASFVGVAQKIVADMQ
nr:TetR/AcrR family transcriptional regulator C-terminal domain-containing protein [Maliibacterium massiliense]